MTTENLRILITGDAKGAVGAFQSVGKSADSDLVKAEKGLDRVGASMQSMGARAVAAGAVMATAMYQAVQSTQDLADSWDKASATFGEGDNGLAAYADDAAVAMGKSKAAALDAASAYGLLFKGAGLSAPDLTKLSADLSVRTADLAEKYKKPFEEANGAIGNAIKTGSNKALRSLLDYGIAITDTDVKTEALTLGIAKQGEVLTRAQKALAVSSLIMKQSAKDAGTYRESVDDVGVQIEVMRANWENAKASLGEAALPVFTELATQVSGIAEAFNSMPEPVRQAASSLALMVTAGSLLGGSLSTVAGTALRVKSALADGASGMDKMTAATGLATVAAVSWGYAITENARQGAEGLDALLPKVEAIREAMRSNNPTDQRVLAFEDARLLAGVDVSMAKPTSALDKIRTALPDQIDVGVFGTNVTADLIAEQQQAVIDRLSESIKGVTTEEARRQVDAYKEAIQEIPGAAEDATKILDPLYEQIRNAEDTERAARATSAYSDALKSIGPGATDLASALENAGLSIEQIDAVVARLDPTTQSASLSLDQFAGAAEAAGIPLDELGAALDAAGVKTETFASKQQAAAQKVSTASNLVIGYERALIRREKAQQNLDGLADKQANDLRTANDAVEDATDAVTEAIKRRTKAQQALNDLNKKSAIAGSVPLLQEITRAAAEMESQAQAAARVAEATYGAGSDQAILANRAAQDAARRRGQAGGFLNQALAEQQGNNARARAEAADAVAEADKAVSRASRDRADAQKQVDQTLAGAATERKEAELDLFEATLGTVDSYGRLKAAIQDGATPVDTLRTALQGAYDQGLIAADQLGVLTGVLNGLTVPVANVVAAAVFGPQTTYTADQWAYYGGGSARMGTGVNAQSFTNLLLGKQPLPSGAQTVNNYNISATDPYQAAAEIAKRNKLAILERKLGR